VIVAKKRKEAMMKVLSARFALAAALALCLAAPAAWAQDAWDGTEGERLDGFAQAMLEAKEAGDSEDWGDALDAYDRALGLYPDSTVAMIRKAMAYRYLGKPKLALDWFKRAVATGAALTADEWSMLGDLHYWDLDDRDSAFDAYTKALSSGQALGWIYLQRARIFVDRGNKASALADLANALDIARWTLDAELAAECADLKRGIAP